MKLVSVFLLCCLLAACAQTTVHLNHRYLDEQQTEAVKTSLQAQGFRVELNQHPFPARVTDNTLIYSPMMRDPAAIERLQDVLQATDWRLPDNRLLVESNQWFTGNNLGLFLVPPDVQVHAGRAAVDLAHHYQSEDCAASYQLRLMPDGRFDFISEDPAYPSFSARWRLTGYPYLQLYQDEPYLNFYYRAERSESRDAVGAVAMIRLEPLSTPLRLPNCTLSYGVRL
ncbi:MAG: hypothetical protein LAT66_12215 [Alkalimonas sp.]|nr:hypothetical protein [Alkalimonas sp.]